MHLAVRGVAEKRNTMKAVLLVVELLSSQDPSTSVGFRIH